MNNSESKIDLVIAGYPKSGNTWLTRLVAQTLDSPSIGYFGKPNLSDTSTEGLNRTGHYRVYKSHELPDGIMRKNKDVVIISIIRDPRETFASGLRFFKSSNKYFQKLPGNQWWVFGHFYRLLDTLFSPKRMFRRRLLNAYVHGNFKVQLPLKIP